ncbi:TIM44-like domain-containing protein [uncultured Pseudodesulfovibrio sp.]|uniref:TIM44-like domain-containing protein n=1 Tax=uncultured Pseudodesulfovibrio sp. TaxID=2035858 RepID=UPI0029C851C2|nr:TIM44-like domain-containing protein [uncultured Pseudodesulfovibrio sp.]
MQDKEDESAHRPMDRHEAARQMWSVLSSEPSETPVRQSPKVESDSFDEAEFLEGAKLFFSRFQQVRDVSELDELRSLLSDSAYEDAVAEVQRRSADEQTEIMLLNARLMDMKTDNNRTDVSVFYDADLRKGVSGEQSVHVRAVWEFSRDGSGENVFWILEKINKVDQ